MATENNMVTSNRRRLAWWRDQRGSSTVEFVIWFPFFMTLFLTSFELSFYSLRSTFLDRAVDVTVRDLRLGNLFDQDDDGTFTTADFKMMVCENMLISGTCADDLRVEQILINQSTWAMPTNSVDCIDRNDPMDASRGFALGGGGDLMLLRICWQKRPFFPTTPLVMGLPRDPDGEIALITTSTYVKEP